MKFPHCDFHTDYKIQIFADDEYISESGGLVVDDDGTTLCTLCNKRLTTFDIGKRHYKEVHTPGGTITCQICKAVMKKRSFYLHAKQIHGISAKALKNVIKPEQFLK